MDLQAKVLLASWSLRSPSRVRAALYDIIASDHTGRHGGQAMVSLILGFESSLFVSPFALQSVAT